MKWLTIFILLAAVPFSRGPQPSTTTAVSTVDHSPFALFARRPESLEQLPFGAIRPEGWLETQIRSNLRGFTGHLDSLAPDLIIKDDIYGRDRLSKDVRRKDVGALAGDSAAEVQYLWWNSETQGN